MARGLLLIFLLTAFAESSSQACTCAGVSFDVAYGRADAVFAGYVLSREYTKTGRTILSSDDPVYYTFEVSRIWKGSAADTIVVRTNRSGASCGSRFELGVHYLVYARDRAEELSTHLCTRNAKIESATADLCRLPSPVYANEAYEVRQPSPDAYAEDLAARVKQGSLTYMYSELVDALAQHETIVPELIAILEEKEVRDQRIAIKVLGSYGYHARLALPYLFDFVCHSEESVRVAACYTLSNICPEAIELFPEINNDWLTDDRDGCTEAMDVLRTTPFGSLPPDSLLDAGGRTGLMYMMKKRKK